MPFLSLQRKSSAFANFSTAALACRSWRESDTSSIAVSKTASLPPVHHRSRSIFRLLRADADHEIEHLINAFTVNETYFYREDNQLRCMTSNLLGCHCRPQRSLAAPCGSGPSRARRGKSPIPSRFG